MTVCLVRGDRASTRTWGCELDACRTISMTSSGVQESPAGLGKSWRFAVSAMTRALADGRRVFFTGCGATGRLSILLEAAWREFWQQLRREHSDGLAGLPETLDLPTGTLVLPKPFLHEDVRRLLSEVAGL